MTSKYLVFALLLLSYAMQYVYVSAQTPNEAERVTGRLQQMMDKVPDGGPTGEQFGWNWSSHLNPLISRCQQTPTDEWLVPTEKILNAMFDKMTEGPDGYKGFVGPYMYNKEYWCDAHVSDSILCAHALSFAMIVHDKPELKQKYKKSYDRFIAIVKKDLIEKWDARKTYVEDGPFAGYREGTLFCKPDDMKNWFEQESGRSKDASSPALPFNKSLDVAHCMLQLYYLTSEASYKAKAEKIYNRVKAGMNRFDGGYTWNYWEPLSPKDITELSPERYDYTHWVGTHPYRNYQRGEVSRIIFAYDVGVTFTEEDINRLVQTNLKFMWNGDKANPEWANSNSKLPGYTRAARPSQTSWAGAIWQSLARFDDTLASLAGSSGEPLKRDRKYAPNAKVEDFPWMRGIAESGGQTLAIAIPSVVPAGESTMILSKCSSANLSPVEIYVKPLYLAGTAAPPASRTLLTTQQVSNSGQMFYRWDGRINGKRTPGEFVIIWKYLDGERAYPVTLR